MTNRLERRRCAAVLAIGVATGLATGLDTASVRAQEAEPGARDEIEGRPIDRWLLSERLDLSADVRDRRAHPLDAPDGSLFPDRDLVVGPGYWHLVREDGTLRFDVERRLEAQRRAHEREEDAPGAGGAMPEGASVLAHAYLRAPADRTVRLDLDAPACAGAAAWLNGQLLADGFGERPVVARLAGGWNTLLVRLDGAPACPLELAAALLPAVGRDEQGRSLPGVDEIRVQASRPPGVRRNFPAPRVTASDLRPGTPLVWAGGSEDLAVPMAYRLSTWGRGAGTEPSAAAADEDERPDEPPGVDLSGEWRLRLFSPLGHEEATARFRQAEDGTLMGDIRGERFSGDVRDGWVSGERFAFTSRFTAQGPAMDVRFEGVAAGDSLHGAVDFGPMGGFESRFDGARPREEAEGEEAREDEPEREDESDPEPPVPPDARPPGPPGRAVRPPFGREAAGQEPDLEALRARIRRQLLPDREPSPPAPARASVEIDLAGERIREAVAGLRPGTAEERSARVSFRKAREAALDRDGARVRVLWDDAEARRRLQIDPADLLRALHAPIALEGWTREGDVWRGVWRVPRILRGFTLAPAGPSRQGAGWRVNGEPLGAGAPLCAPCREGERLEIELSGAATTDSVRAVIVEPGHPAAADRPDAPPARQWLEALRGDNSGYLELSRRHAGA